jgi:mannose-1-phosphate guanylyltransferase/mannose-6-phosphate isomerase
MSRAQTGDTMTDHMLRMTPLIMAGGAGTRLWPLSRSAMPKQFLPLIGALSPFQNTLNRVSDRALFHPPVIITHTDFRFFVDEQLKAIGITDAVILLEPARRDSAAAIAAASVYIAQNDSQAMILALAADHHIADHEDFKNACLQACACASAGHIVTFGMTPTSPHTGYGYIKPYENVLESGAYAVATFVEKPDADTAKRYVKEVYLWNSGNFLFRADVMLEELALHAPNLLNPIREAVEQRTHDLNFERLAPAPFARTKAISIDYAVMEHTTRAAVLPCTFEWSDLGTWDAIWQVLPKDEAGNAITGQAHVMNTSGTMIHSEGPLIAVEGLENIAVIATKDAVLVMPRDHSAALKEFVREIESSASITALQPAIEHRPWGYYEEVDRGGRFKVKRIVVKPDCRLSLQKHLHRSEHWVVVHGTAEVTIGNTVQMVQENESIYVPLGMPHRLANPGKIPLEVIEVQTGSYLAEDDILRLSDDFNRV